MKTFSLKLLIIFVFGLLSSCYDDQLNIQPKQKQHPVFPDHPSSGELEVKISTDGGQGQYIVKVKGVEEKKVQANDQVYFALSKGTYEVELVGLDGACVVSGNNPQIVNMMPKKKTTISFEVSCSSSAEQIVFIQSHNGARQLSSMNVDGSNVQQLKGYPGLPQLSPDGSKILFTSPSGIFTMDSDGNNLKQITFLGEDGLTRVVDKDASWSNDGTKIVFIRQDGEEYFNEIYVIDADGSNLTSLATSAEYFYAPSISPDGSKVLYSGADLAEGAKIYNIDTHSLHTELIIDHKYNNFEPVWSPDGTKILFIGADYSDHARQIFVANADGSGIEQLTFDTPLTKFNANWSPDGSKIVYVAGIPYKGSESDFNIYTMNSDGTNVKQLTDAPGYEFYPYWATGPVPTEVTIP